MARPTLNAGENLLDFVHRAQTADSTFDILTWVRSATETDVTNMTDTTWGSYRRVVRPVLLNPPGRRRS